MSTTATPVLCEILAPRAAQAAAFAEIAATCARDTGQPLQIEALPARRVAEPVLTLHLPAALAAAQHPIWCLACRLACFCPDLRVSVLVEGSSHFAPPPARHRAA